MRFLLVLIIWTVIVGGLWSYVSHRDHKREQITAAVPVDLSVEDLFTIEITPTFSIEKDPFALTTSESSASLLELRLNGNEIRINAADMLRGQTIRQENVEGFLVGSNEIYVSASPPLSENTLEHGIRIKLFDESGLLIDQTVWAKEGALVSGTISFSYFPEEDGRHDH